LLIFFYLTATVTNLDSTSIFTEVIQMNVSYYYVVKPIPTKKPKDHDKVVANNLVFTISQISGAVVVVIVWYLDLHLTITTNVVSSNPSHGKMY